MGDRISSLSMGEVSNIIAQLHEAGLTGRQFRRLGQDSEFLTKVMATIAAADKSVDDCVVYELPSMPPEATRSSLYEEILDRYGRGWYLIRKDLIERNFSETFPKDCLSPATIFLLPLWEKMMVGEAEEELAIRGLKPASVDEAIRFIHQFGLEHERAIYILAARLKLHDGDEVLLSIDDGIRARSVALNIPRSAHILAIRRS